MIVYNRNFWIPAFPHINADKFINFPTNPIVLYTKILRKIRRIRKKYKQKMLQNSIFWLQSHLKPDFITEMCRIFDGMNSRIVEERKGSGRLMKTRGGRECRRSAATWAVAMAVAVAEIFEFHSRAGRRAGPRRSRTPETRPRGRPAAHRLGTRRVSDITVIYESSIIINLV